MFRRRPRTPPRKGRAPGGRGMFRKPWTPGNKTKIKKGPGPAECTIPELKHHYFDCGSIHEADRYITTNKAIIAYMGATYGGDIKATLENCRIFTFPEPDDPVDNYNDIEDKDGKVVRYAKNQMTYKEQKKFDHEMSAFVKRKELLAKHMEQAYSIYLNQCTEYLQDKLKNTQRWETVSSTQNVLDLIELIKIIVFKYEEQQYLPLSVFNAKSAFYMFNQGSMNLNEYREKFNNIVQIISSYDVEIFERKDLYDKCCVMFPDEMGGNSVDEFANLYPEKW